VTDDSAGSNLDFANLDYMQAVVTGASTGIGRAIALELAAAGADVLIQYRQSEQQAQQVVEHITSLGRKSRQLQADFSTPAACAGFVNQVKDLCPQVDIWVNNAGVDLLTGAACQSSYQDKLQQLLDIDVRSAILLSKQVGEWMQQQGCGVILNIGWDQADRGMAGDSGELFAAAKNAIMGVTRSLAASLAPQVRVNCIAPGWIKTAWGEQASDYWQQRVQHETPLKRWGTPLDIAKLARFLVSDEAAYITGQVINVNGGAVR